MAGRGEQRGGQVGLRPAATVLAVAGALWWGVAAGAVVQGGAATVAWVAAGVVAAVLVLLPARRRLSSAGAHEAMAAHSRTYALVNTAQLAGIAAVVVVAGRAGVPAWIPVGVTAVFAVHFLPFARPFGWRGYTWLAVALLAVALLGAGLAVAGVAAAGVHAGVGPAVAGVLWGAVLLAVRGRSARGSGVPAMPTTPVVPAGRGTVTG